MTINSLASATPALVRRTRALPRYAVVSAWAIPLMVLGQFAMLAIVPVTLLLIGVFGTPKRRTLRWTSVVLAATYAMPLAVWVLRENPARSLSRDMHPGFVAAVVATSLAVLVALHRRRTPAADTTPGTAAVEVVLPGLVDPDGLVVRRTTVHSPGAHQATVRMIATGVSFAESSMRRGRYPGQPKFPFVPGYDVVGIVTAVGSAVDRALIGQRVAAVTKTGSWSTHSTVDARDLVAVPDGVDAAEAVALAVNGITAWQMLHRAAKTKRGQTILIHGASGGVGYTLAQLALSEGIQVIGSASPRHHHALSELGVSPVDYRDPDLLALVRELAPHGVDAVFDNLGEDTFSGSFGLLAPGGTLVGYGTASAQDSPRGMLVTFAGILSRFTLWNLQPNQRRAVFYNFWGGKSLRPSRFRRRLSADAAEMYSLLSAGSLQARVAERIPLAEAGRALALFESRTADGKIVLVP